jgi:hypothetical protein
VRGVCTKAAKFMNTMNFALAVALASALCTWTQTWAQSKAPLPLEHHRGAVTWISGGVSKNAADAMRGVASRYNVRLVMAEAREPRAAFLGAVPVKISDAKKHVVLDIKTDGPLLFLKLPPGRYTVSAKVAGHVLSKSFRAKDRGSQEITLIWPERVK